LYSGTTANKKVSVGVCHMVFYDNLLDTKEEISLVSLLRCAADGENSVELVREMLCELPTFEPYQVFKALQRDSVRCMILLDDLIDWVREQPYKSTLLTESDLAQAVEPFISGDKEPALRYEGFLKLVLPRDSPMLRSLAMTRHGDSLDFGARITREVGERFIRLLEAEAQVHAELVARKRRLIECSRVDPMQPDIIQRSFRWLQSESSVPGLSHISPLGLRRMLHDLIGAASLDQVGSLFRRINVSSSGMLSFYEWENFLTTKGVDEFLSQRFLTQFTTDCPGCGVSVQRDGGACPTVTCPFCRHSFNCYTNSDLTLSKETEEGAAFDTFDTLSRRTAPTFRASLPGRICRAYGTTPTTYPSYAQRSVLSEGARPRTSGSFGHGGSRPKSSERLSEGNTRSFRSAGVSRGVSPHGRSSLRSYSSPRKFQKDVSKSAGVSDSGSRQFHKDVSPSRKSYHSISTAASPRDMDLSFSPNGKQRFSTTSNQSLNLVLDTMAKLTDLDLLMDNEKQLLQRMDVHPETVFELLDRYQKGYVADTDVWQTLHEDGSPGPVSFSGVCSLFREIKPKHYGTGEEKGFGRLSMAEICHLVSARDSEVVKMVDLRASDADALSILYSIRHTVACPGCGMRAQRTADGCPSVTCPVCFTAFRCTIIEDRDCSSFGNYHTDELVINRSTRMAIQKCLKKLIDYSEEAERVKKNLAASSWESLSTVIMDSFLELSRQRGYFDLTDVKQHMSLNNMWRSEKEFHILWNKFAGQKHRMEYPDLADQLRPYSAQIMAY